MSAPAIFLDRDGTLNELVSDPVSGQPESPLRPEDVALVPGAAAAARSLSEAGWVLIGVTNQPAAAKEKVTLAVLQSVHARVIQLLEREGVHFADFRFCFHHPDGTLPDLSGPCDCRKPAPGMLRDAMREQDIDAGRSWMIGDTDGDVLAGQAAGCRSILLQYPGSAHKRTGKSAPDMTTETLHTAAAWLRTRVVPSEPC